MNPRLTVITPIFNRKEYLQRLFHCLDKQTCKDFEWIIVDDGSKELLADEIQEIQRLNECLDYDEDSDLVPRSFAMSYYRKPNGGKHTALNLGVTKARGELCLILDSDDELPPKAIETIVGKWSLLSVSQRQELGGMCFYMAHYNGKRIGSRVLNNVLTDSIDMRYRLRISGDMCEIFRTDILRNFFFPVIQQEKFCPEQLVWFRIAQKYKLKLFNDVVYLRDYLEGGLTNSIVKIRMESPVASCMTYGEMLEYKDIPFIYKIKAAINYWRFHACLHHAGDTTVEWYWYVFKPVGDIMHLLDKR